jgi:hypothetical protein
VNVKFDIEIIHELPINEDQNNKDIHRTLLCEPEAQRITTDAHAVERICEQDATAE